MCRICRICILIGECCNGVESLDALEGTGKHWNILGRTGRCWNVLEGAGTYWKVLERVVMPGRLNVMNDWNVWNAGMLECLWKVLRLECLECLWKVL